MCHSTKRLYFPDVVEPESQYDKYPIVNFPGQDQMLESYGSIREMCDIKGMNFDEYMDKLNKGMTILLDPDVLLKQYRAFIAQKRDNYGF